MLSTEHSVQSPKPHGMGNRTRDQKQILPPKSFLYHRKGNINDLKTRESEESQEQLGNVVRQFWESVIPSILKDKGKETSWRR